MKILVVGSNGMLGSNLCEQLEKRNIPFVGYSRDCLDISNKEEVDKKINDSFNYVINCAAYTNVDAAESNHELCDAVNVVGVKNLVDRVTKLGTGFITVSTDYVFDGKTGNYNEEDNCSPINYYGLSKFKGEEYVKENLSNFYIARTSWLFGKNGKNFVETIIKLSNEKKELKVVNDQRGSPTYVVDLANAITDLIIKKSNPGIYHLNNSGNCTWFEFAKEIIHSDCNLLPCTTSEFPRDAKRPENSIMINNKTALLPHWKNALERYLLERQNI